MEVAAALARYQRLALYLLDRLRELDLLNALPSAIQQRLQQNLHDNTERTLALAEECCAIQKDFDAAGVSCAVLKGISLWPHAVPRLELRSQLDLDFLVAAADASTAQRLLKLRGYQLQAISGRSWEFKTPYAGVITLADLYCPRRCAWSSCTWKNQEPGCSAAANTTHCARFLCQSCLQPSCSLGRHSTVQAP